MMNSLVCQPKLLKSAPTVSRWAGLTLGGLVATLAMSRPAGAETLYSITDLGSIPDVGSKNLRINNSGQVAGTSVSGMNSFRTAPNSPINPETDDLGTLGGTSSSATGINKSGQVVGSSSTASGEFHAFRTAPNSPINPETDDLGTLGGTVSFAFGINKSGQVVGYSRTASGEFHAFRTDPNSPINPETDDLGTLGGRSITGGGDVSSSASDINKLGQVVGSSRTASTPQVPAGEIHAFRTAPNSPINPETDDLGTLGGSYSEATGINKTGQVVGYSDTARGSSSYHAFRTAANSPINPETDDLGTLGGYQSFARGINKSGQVVGFSDTASGQNHAFLYDVSGDLIDLNSLISPDSPSNFSVLRSATAINDRGQIVGVGIIDGQTHAFLATPVNTDEVTTQSSGSPAKD